MATSSAITTDHDGEIYVANEGERVCFAHCGCNPTGHGTVTVYSPGAKGDAPPRIRIRGAHTGLDLPYEITVDSSGDIYVLNAPGSAAVCFYFGGGEKAASEAGPIGRTAHRVRTFNLNDPILVFAADTDGDVAPVRTIGVPLSGLGGASALAFLPASQDP